MLEALRQTFKSHYKTNSLMLFPSPTACLMDGPRPSKAVESLCSSKIERSNVHMKGS